MRKVAVYDAAAIAAEREMRAFTAAMQVAAAEVDEMVGHFLAAALEQVCGDGGLIIVGFLGETHPMAARVDGEFWPDAHTMRFPKDEPAGELSRERLDDWLARSGTLLEDDR
jgi:hypothetical protein